MDGCYVIHIFEKVNKTPNVLIDQKKKQIQFKLNCTCRKIMYYKQMKQFKFDI